MRQPVIRVQTKKYVILVIEPITRLFSVRGSVARPKTKQPRVIRADDNYYCQNSDIQRGIAAVREFEVTAASLTDLWL
jgi:hypothetical protein